jgi:hypothetical protein
MFGLLFHTAAVGTCKVAYFALAGTWIGEFRLILNRFPRLPILTAPEASAELKK